jgi:hypothetical protein
LLNKRRVTFLFWTKSHNHFLGVELMLNKMGILVTAICLTTLSLPSYAWQAAGIGGAGVARGTYGGAAAWNRNTGNAVVRGPNGNVAAVNGGYGGAYRAPVPAYGYRGGAYYGNNGYSSGQVAAAGVAGLAVGAMAGAAVANRQSSNTTVIVQQPVIAIGTNLNSLPSGCSSTNINGIQYFQCGSSWMRSYGNYYQVVPSPY